MVANSFTDLFAYIAQLMTTHAAMFTGLGNSLFRSFAIISIVWFGVEVAFRGQGFPMERFAKMLLMISFCLAMTRYYSSPIPGFGKSFYHLIFDEGTFLAAQIEGSMVTKVMNRLDSLYFGLESPGLSSIVNLVETARWVITILAIVAAEAAVFLVVSFGYLASAVCVLLGPVFIPFFIVPGLEWIFWGWLRSLLQYAFYPVVANAFVFVMGNLLINFVDRAGTELTGGQLAVAFLPLLYLLIAFTWGLLRVPSLCNSLFTGKSGESAVPLVG